MTDLVITRERLASAIWILSGAIPFDCELSDEFCLWYDAHKYEVDGFTLNDMKMAAADVLMQIIMPMEDV